MVPILKLKRVGQVIEDQPPEMLGYDEIHILAIYSRGTLTKKHRREYGCLKSMNHMMCLCRQIDKDGATIAENAYDDIMMDIENSWLVETT